MSKRTNKNLGLEEIDPEKAKLNLINLHRQMVGSDGNPLNISPSVPQDGHPWNELKQMLKTAASSDYNDIRASQIQEIPVQEITFCGHGDIDPGDGF